ncbi:M23 family metallopeptidase [Desulforamulus hydrothermalis]|uniref:Peptidase M23B n=1 Tax=Desulforamulus hydrothermalis Lam5 = DSM 18033 TaxID=1121428 RepID=K8DZF7_9FIRM|nr:M23 family metallopeptidase [Desulforamulus hydrothermalis]CCO08439.1 Peptidase M23B [Desulforamulus hydrothermalis Lam5 = DSM 18033]SHH15455.1 Peptidase family M23 [Desulforamulus hydrothermalis Lam5 = DSM 18033]
MWPFDNNLRNRLRNQDLVNKYRQWLKKWFFKGNKVNPFTLLGVMLAAFLIGGGIYAWQAGPARPVVQPPTPVNQVINQDNGTAAGRSTPPAAAPAGPAAGQPAATPPAPSEPAVNPADMVKPVLGHALTGVGMNYSEVYRDYRYHTGVALAADPGSEVKAALPGTVTLVVSGDNNTKTVTVNHGNGWQTAYSGLAEVRVKAGQQLAPNQVIGTLGRHSQANGLRENHLYFKVTCNGRPVDPNIYWK